jgi:hypothetical protein
VGHVSRGPFRARTAGPTGSPYDPNRVISGVLRPITVRVI